MPTDLSKIDFSSFNKLPGIDSLPGTMGQALREDPEKYSSNLRLANQSGLSVDSVAGDPVAVESRLKFDKINFEEMSVRNPNTSKFLTTFDNAVIAQDDVPLLERLENLFHFSEGLKESIGLDFKKQGLGVALASADLTPDEVSNLIPAGALPFGIGVRERQRMSRQFASNLGINTDEELALAKQESIQQLTEEVRQVESRQREITPEDLTLLEQGVRSGISSLANMSGGFALMLLTGGRAAMLAPIGLQTGFGSFAKARGEGMQPGEAAAFAMLNAAIEVGTELLPTGTLERMITGKSSGKMGREAIRFLIQEMGTEQIATLGQSLNSYLFGLDEQLNQAEGAGEVVNIMLERAAVTAIATAVAGGAQAGVVVGLRSAIEATAKDQQAQVQTSTQEQATLQELNQIAEDSKLRQRSPEAFSEFIKDLDEDNDSHVFIDSAQLSLYLQENADQITEDPALMMLAEAVQKTAANGTDASIAVQDFATVIAATPHFEALQDSMTLAQESIAPFRQEQMKKETENYVSKLVDQAQENVTEYIEAQNIFLNIRDQIVDTGQISEQSANTMAQLVPAWATVFANRNGITVKEAFEQSGLTVEGPQTGEAARLEKEGQTLFQRARARIFGADTVTETFEQKVFEGPVAPGGVDSEQIIAAVKESGGISLNAEGQLLNADTGFVVSVRSMNVEDIAQAPNMVRATLENLKSTGRTDLTVGVFDMGDGRFSIDTNVVAETEEEAIAIAQEFDQQSVFNLSTLSTIETGGQGTGATEQKFQQFLQREPVPNTTGLNSEGVLDKPPVEHGVIALDHYSRESGIDVLDPTKFGTGIRSEESNRSGDPFWVNRTNHGIATGRDGGYKKEQQLGAVRYRTVVPASSIYDLKLDLEGFKEGRSEAKNPRERINLLEQRVKEAGYLGYWSNHPSHGLVAVTFDPLPTNRVYDLKQPAEGGTSNVQVGFTEERIDNILEDFEHVNGFETKARIGFVNPVEFVNATSANDFERISEEAGELNLEALQDETQDPYIIVQGNEIIGHEGRHRLSALAGQGITRVPIVIRYNDFQDADDVGSETQNFKFKGQDFVQGVGDSLNVEQAILALSSNKEQISEMMSDSTILFQDDRGYFDEKTSTIKLTAAADLTTFIHEFAHFVYDQELRASGDLLPEINRWFESNTSSLAKEAGVSEAEVTAHINGTTESEAVRVATHEQFARGFETYLMEGKSPTVELGGVFRTIARWMQQIYSAIRNTLNVNLDDQMRQVFDRLLATEEQIAAAEARVQAVPLFDSAEAAEITEEQFKDYELEVRSAEDVAHEKLRNSLISQLTRQATKEWNSEKSDIVDRLTTRLEQTKVYRTIRTLRDGEVKLDRAAVKEMVGQEAESKKGTKFIKMPPQVRNMTVTGTKGLHPDEAAVLFGYGSGNELLADIILADPIKSVSEEAAEIRMKEIHGDILNDGTIEAEADAALQNEERAKVLLTELRALSRGTNVQVIDRQVIKQIAQRQIGKLAYRSIHPGKYRKAELAAAQRAAVALDQGNKEEAARAKLDQVTNFYLSQAASEARVTTDKIVLGMSRYRKKDIQNRIQKAENGYWEQIVKILERFEFRRSATLRGVDQRNQDINSWMRERMEQDGDALMMTPAILDEGYVTHWKNVPHEELLGINESVKNIEHVARYANKMTLLQEDIDFKKLVSVWTTHMGQANTAKFKPQRTSVAEGRKFGEWAMAQLTKIPWLASWLDGGARVGMTHDILVQPFTNALDEEFKLYKEAAKPVVEAMNARSNADIKRHNTKIFIREIKDEENDGNLMGHQVLAVALNTGNESNLRKLLLGEGWANPDNDAEIVFENPKLQAVLKHMTESDWKLVQLIWDQMDVLYPQLSEVHRKTTGQVPPKVESTPITTPFGDFNGGYYPVKYDATRSQTAFLNEERLSAQVDSMFSTSGSIHASVNASSVNKRTGFYAPIRLSLDIVPNHFQETIHFITHHDAVRQVNKLISNKEVRDTISAKLGPEEFAQLKPWLNDLAKDGRESPNKGFIDQVFGQLRLGVTLGIMGFKASTGIIQISGLSNSIAEVGASNMAQAMRMVLGSPKKIQEAWLFAKEHSRVLEHRVQTMDREMRSAFESLEGKRGFVAAVQETSMKHIAYVQTFLVDLPSWYAAYIKELGLSGDEQKAYKYADFVIEQVQGSGATKDMAAAMRNQSKTHRIFTMFMTFFSSLWNAQRDTARGARSKLYSTTTVAAKLMTLITIPVIFEMALRGDLTDEDEEFDVQKMLTNMALFPIQGVPLLRDVATGVAGDFGYNLTPVASVVEKGLEGIRQIAVRGVTDAEITKGQVKNASKLAGAFLGVPGVNQAWATGEHLFEVLVNGEDFTTRELLFGPDRE